VRHPFSLFFFRIFLSRRTVPIPFVFLRMFISYSSRGVPTHPSSALAGRSPIAHSLSPLTSTHAEYQCQFLCISSLITRRARPFSLLRSHSNSYMLFSSIWVLVCACCLIHLSPGRRSPPPECSSLSSIHTLRRLRRFSSSWGGVPPPPPFSPKDKISMAFFMALPTLLH